MFGFLIHDERLFSTSVAVGACRALRTYSYQNTEHMGLLRIHFFRNASLNSYFASDERYTICVTGTLIFNNVHGRRALSNLLDALHSGRELVDLFDQFRGPYTLIQIDRIRRHSVHIEFPRGTTQLFFGDTERLKSLQHELASDRGIDRRSAVCRRYSPVHPYWCNNGGKDNLREY